MYRKRANGLRKYRTGHRPTARTGTAHGGVWAVPPCSLCAVYPGSCMTLHDHVHAPRLCETINRERVGDCGMVAAWPSAAASATHQSMQNKCVTVWTVESITSKKLKRGTDLLKTRKNKETGCALGGCAQHAAGGTRHVRYDGRRARPSQWSVVACLRLRGS